MQEERDTEGSSVWKLTKKLSLEGKCNIFDKII